MIGALRQLDCEQRCELLYFDESGFSPNPPVQYGWPQIGQTRAVEPLAHRQRVNVLGALRHNGQLTCTTQQRPTKREDVIAFFDQIAEQPHSVPRIVLLNNAGIHKATPWRSSGVDGPSRAAFVLFAALKSRTRSHRDFVEARQVLLAPLRCRERRRSASRNSVADERFRKRIHGKFCLGT